MTPPILKPVEKVMNDQTGNDVATLREVVIALARDAVFGREELIVAGKTQEASIERNWIILKQYCTPDSQTCCRYFEQIWTLCRQSMPNHVKL